MLLSFYCHSHDSYLFNNRPACHWLFHLIQSPNRSKRCLFSVTVNGQNNYFHLACSQNGSWLVISQQFIKTEYNSLSWSVSTGLCLKSKIHSSKQLVVNSILGKKNRQLILHWSFLINVWTCQIPGVSKNTV